MTIRRRLSGVNLHFAHDTKMALLSAAALVNTTPELSDSGTDEFSTVDALNAFVDEHQYSGAIRGTDDEVAEMQSIRPRLNRLWGLDVAGAVQSVNELLREFDALPQLVRHDGWDWHVHAVSAERPLPERVCVETALAVIEIIRADELRRLRRCDAEDCDAVLVDLSRNRSKRYCEVGNCGNRTHVAAYRSRQANS